MLERSFWFRAALVVVVLSAGIYLFGALGRLWGFLGDLLLIFFLAYLVGSLLIHIVNSLMRIPHMRRPLAILMVYLALLTLLADLAILVVPATVDQVKDLAQRIPGYVAGAPDLIARFDEFLVGFGIELDLQNKYQVESLDNFATTAAQVLADNAGSIFQNVAATLFGLSLIVVISFYIVLDGGRRLNEALKVLPPRAESETRFVLGTIDETFHGYLRGILLISLIYGVGTAAVMMATGLPAALPVAIISSILLVVPFVGDWLALALPLIVAAVAGDFVTFLIVLATLLFVQQVMLNLLTPRILGRAVHMPAMLVIVAVVIGARLAGVPGALLGVPTAAVLYTLSVHYGMRIRERREARDVARSTADDEAVTDVTPAPPSTAPSERDRPPAPRRTAARVQPTEPASPLPIAGAAPPEPANGDAAPDAPP